MTEMVMIFHLFSFIQRARKFSCSCIHNESCRMISQINQTFGQSQFHFRKFKTHLKFTLPPNVPHPDQIESIQKCNWLNTMNEFQEYPAQECPNFKNHRNSEIRSHTYNAGANEEEEFLQQQYAIKYATHRISTKVESFPLLIFLD